MQGSWNFIGIVHITLSFLFFIYDFEEVFAASSRHLCRPDQRDALLEFKNEFIINSSTDRLLKTESWAINNDCCSWEGIKCNAKSGEVIELDLSSNNLQGRFHSNSSLQNLHFLTTLDLSHNHLSGPVLSSIGNLSLLSSLHLSDNYLSGPIPSSIGKLSLLTTLGLSYNNFVGEIPFSFGNLNQLTALSVSKNELSGSLPITLLNLTRLSSLELYYNELTGTLPPNISSLSNLIDFDACDNAFSGTIPSSLFTIPFLETICLSNNQLDGILELGNISSTYKLQWLQVSHNNLRGPIPSSISKFTNLERLELSNFNTQGPVDFRIFSHLKVLAVLDLSHLNTTTTIDLNGILSYFPRLVRLDLSGNYVSATNTSLSQGLYVLQLSRCGITEFPDFVRNQSIMEILDISNNKIKGQVPDWLWTLPSLQIVDISNNSFNGFESSMNPIVSLSMVMMYLFGSNNNFTGKIPSFICEFPALTALDLSNNNFNGLIPSCVGQFSSSLSDLNLRWNRLQGGLPENISESLRSFDVGHNQLTGRFPISWIHLTNLEVLNVENNGINDTFPLWLSSLPELKVLVLRSNTFHGPIHQASFPNLQIIDISRNHFNGTLPSDYFMKWNAMSSLGTNDVRLDDKYMGDRYYKDSLVLMNKGAKMELKRILRIYTALDFSGNNLEGEIPRSIGVLKRLHILDLSNNAFIGHIPSSLGNLTTLESLDVSQNHLLGVIPQELGSLSFLAYMNFSHNQLSGPIPRGTQFRTQNCSSFEDNKELFGPSLEEVCREIHTAPSLEMSESEEEGEEVVSWIAVAVGTIPGIVLGLTIGYILDSYKPEWFKNRFG